MMSCRISSSTSIACMPDGTFRVRNERHGGWNERNGIDDAFGIHPLTEPTDSRARMQQLVETGLQDHDVGVRR